MILRQLTDEIGLKPINDIRTGSLSTLGSNSEGTILTLTATTDHKISRISCTGDSYAMYKLYIDTNLIETKKVGRRYIDFIFPIPLLLSNGETLDVKVTHFYTGKTFDFDATIYSRI